MKKMYKIFVNVPSSHTEILLKAAANAGAGEFGNYTHCSFITKGIGTAKPNNKANPYVGKIGKIYHEKEDRFEIISDKLHLVKVIDAIKEVHPYEKPIIEVYEIDVYTK